MLYLVVESHSITRYTTIDIHICLSLSFYIFWFSFLFNHFCQTLRQNCARWENTHDFTVVLGYKVGMEVLESHIFLIKQAQLVDIVL